MWNKCEVTREHINKGEIGEGSSCAIALAIEDHPASTSYKYVSAHGSGIDFFMKGTNADDGYADEAIESIIHPDDEYIYQSFISDFDMVETDKDRNRLQEFNFRFKLK